MAYYWMLDLYLKRVSSKVYEAFAAQTCRYCPYCDLIIAHQDEIEQQLIYLFMQQQPEMIGNDYLVIGTLDKADW